MNSQRHMAEVAMLGCIVCKQEGKTSPAEVHHILNSGRKISDKHVIPLCTLHHRSGMNTDYFVSRHPWKREFEKRYGTEQELLELTQAELDRVRGGVY